MSSFFNITAKSKEEQDKASVVFAAKARDN